MSDLREDELGTKVKDDMAMILDKRDVFLGNLEHMVLASGDFSVRTTAQCPSGVRD
jgi:hypothetical protein